jgi:competence protein ComFB
MVNIMEKIVGDRLSHLLENFDCCKCDICKDDMLAIALNNVPTKYVTSHKGELFGRTETLNQHISTDLDITIIKAINRVARTPNHG